MSLKETKRADARINLNKKAMKTNFQIITLMEYVYPILMIRVWYETNHKPLTSTNLLTDSLAGKLGKVETDALVDALKFEHNISGYMSENPGTSIIFLN